jgi:hypothetical protein
VAAGGVGGGGDLGCTGVRVTAIHPLDGGTVDGGGVESSCALAVPVPPSATVTAKQSETRRDVRNRARRMPVAPLRPLRPPIKTRMVPRRGFVKAGAREGSNGRTATT